jgi:hypothetical protein
MEGGRESESESSESESESEGEFTRNDARERERLTELTCVSARTDASWYTVGCRVIVIQRRSGPP